ncbi:MAG: Fe2+-dependent dioxygenase [Pseudomonadota bacterium]
MLITIENVLASAELATVRELLEHSSWASGAVTAGAQAAQAKNNQQLPEDAQQLTMLRHMVMSALSRNATFFSAALPLRILPPLFNRYAGETNHYGFHTDSAMHPVPGGNGYIRADVSATLFLSEPEEYDGGILTIADTFGHHGIKLKAGSMVVYPASSIHQVSPVTRGQRLGCFMFMQSMVRDIEQRRLLFDMDISLMQLRQSVGETAAVVSLTGTYHNLLRRWAES